MRTHLLAAALFLSACSAPVGSDDDAGETGDAEIQAWAEIRCTDTTFGAVAMVRPPGEGDAWAYAIHADELERRTDHLEPVDSWPQDSCAAGQVPETFMPEVRCYESDLNGRVGCYVGDGTWFAAAVPECDPDFAGLEFRSHWPEDGCADQHGSADPFDSISCADGLACIGWSGNAAMLVLPTCEVEARPHLPGDRCN